LTGERRKCRLITKQFPGKATRTMPAQPLVFSNQTMTALNNVLQTAGQEAADAAQVSADEIALSQAQANAVAATQQLATDEATLAADSTTNQAALVSAIQSMMQDLGVPGPITVPAITPPPPAPPGPANGTT
jgi:hypothetical protein